MLHTTYVISIRHRSLNDTYIIVIKYDTSIITV